MPPSASVIVPTLGRPAYLDVALASIAAQADDILVVEDGPPGVSREIAERHGARYLSLGKSQGLNAARNAGLHASEGALVVFVDDDVRVGPGWLAALLSAAEREPAAEVFTGPIRASFEGHRLRMCGREGPPITSMDLGSTDCEAPHAWGANMAIRRTALERIGDFDPRLSGGGDEQEWQARHGGPIRYIAAAALEHRRCGDDARLRALMRASFRRGREVRGFEQEERRAPRLAGELRVLAGCLWHIPRRRCANGFVMAAHTAGRIVAARAQAPAVPAEDFLSGESGTVGGRRDLLRAAADAALDLVLRTQPVRTRSTPPRQVLVMSVVRPEHRANWTRESRKLRDSRHQISLIERPPGENGKFENLNAMLEVRKHAEADWLLILDDDVVLPRDFLDRFLALCERFELQLAQPAHRLRSHAAWRLTRRRAGSLTRETRFVEIGPVTALHRSTWPVLLPFPNLRMGWGLDAHWSALAEQHGWRIGIVDATPIAHLAAPVADTYSHDSAIREAREFLAARPYLPASESQRTLSVHRRCA